ncbi:MAG: protein-disulfide reductase DsbD domain-containing protein [Bacteroidota bacterium]
MQIQRPRPLTYLLLILMASWSQLAMGQFDFMKQGPNGGATFSHRLDGEPAQVGAVITVRMEAVIDPGYHLYAAGQVPEAEANAAIFDLDQESQDIELIGGLQDGLKPKVKFDDVFGYDLAEFYGSAVFLQQIKITGPNPRLVGFMRYQVCNASQCIPKTYDLDEGIEVKAAPTRPAEVVTLKKDAPANEPEQAQAVEAPKALVPVESPPEEEETAPETTPKISQAERNQLLAAVTWEVGKMESGELTAGETLDIVLSANIAEGYKVYSSTPPAEPAGLPATFNLNGKSRDVSLVGGLKEEGEALLQFDPIFQTQVRVFEKEVKFIQSVKITGEQPVLEGYLSYQVCNDKACVNETLDVFEEFPAAPTTSISEVKEESFAESSLGVLMLKGFLLGLVSIFTPCIFPMIPLTVSIFTKQGSARAEGLRKALLYGLSIVGIFTGLAVVISAVFGATALQETSNSPAFNLFFFAMLFIFALSFMGMFEITLPSSWSTAVSKQSDRGGFLGIFFMALALAIVSFSCTGPIVSYALGDAMGRSFFSPILIMLSFSTALALPFVLLAAFPALLKSMPRSGGWLNAVKVSLGLIELALAFIYLSRADLVMHWGLLDREIFIGAWIVIFAMLGMYLLGKIRLPHDDPPVEKLSVPRFLLAMGTFWFVLYLVPGLWGAPLKMLGGFIPSSTKDMGVLIQAEQLSSLGSASPATSGICNYPNKISGHLSEDTPTGFCAFYDLEQGLAYAKEVNKPVFLDFTGHTCANCRYLEKNAWVDPGLKEYITQRYVLVSLYTDDRESLPQVEKGKNGKKLRTVGDKWLNYQVETYGSNAQPFYVLLDTEGQELIPPTGYNPPLDLQAYEDFFQRGLDEFQRR